MKNELFNKLPRLVRNKLKNIKMSPIGYRLARGTFWSALGSSVSRFFYLIASIIAARILGKVGYGELGIIQSTVTLFGTAAGFGLSATMTKQVAEFRDENVKKTGRVIVIALFFGLLISLLGAILLFGMAGTISKIFLKDENLKIDLQLSSFLLFATGVYSIQIGILTGFESFKKMAWANCVSGICYLIFFLLFTFYWKLLGAILGLASGMLINVLINQWIILKECSEFSVPLSFKNLTKEWKTVFSFSLPVLLAGSVFPPAQWIVNTFLINQPNGYEQMGAFNAVNQWFIAVSYFPVLVSQTALPMMANAWGSKKYKEAFRYLRLSMSNNAWIFLLIVPIMISSQLILSLYGKNFEKEWPSLVISLLSAGVLAFQSALGWFLVASGKIWEGLMFNILWAVIFVSLSYLYSGWGALGITTAKLIAYSLQGIFLWFYIKEIHRIYYKKRNRI